MLVFGGHGDGMEMANKALHLTAIPLRSIAAGELGHSPFEKSNDRS